MKFNAKFAGALIGAITVSGAAFAGYVTPPGERAGIDLATPLPEGVYFVNLAAAVGNDRRFGAAADFNFDVPVLVWSTPWTLAGGRIELGVAAPVLELGFYNRAAGGYQSGFYNPFVFGSINWSLGNGFSIGFLQGAYIGISGGSFGDAFNQTTLDEMLELAWHGDGWNATANIHYNIVGDNQASGLTPAQRKNSDALIYDLGLTKTIDKWEIGAVGFGSNTFGVAGGVGTVRLDQSQFALGGLLGYNFGPIVTQAFVTTDVYKSNYPTYETRGWLRTVIPLWNPEAPKTVAAKY
ncbi:Putative MetA-pathway of phenol degradation [Rhodoblastus acidophilus]|uniref:Putative MetA-pathway of phenol degradation n=1 Tax=Rhodoblastus acidophilus TaxID=1074 RepID=A0A212RT75_RHOAC|nr:transporter [Rhodoblastus acidophilus]MCW2315444.1 hypothetical protein [Rhodoblastus acidophilus]PPQ40713.1 transporter [Rhodoblastus acidophilus]RAI21909.1 transporter [Rhodoblastus acidophilus]SNB75808.1 Putative MetA-pathway of phenol degradation [Rhodoblastus acidophilus]